MTTHEATETMARFDAKRSYNATKEVWSHASDKERRGKIAKYTISALPGKNGTVCSQWSSEESFDHAVEMAIRDLAPVPVPANATSNNE